MQPLVTHGSALLVVSVALLSSTSATMHGSFSAVLTWIE
jgi:hypothetical protein